ncbi:haloalkane dehalogenase [Pelagibacteraceae bacterium]|nr:haloalkane dehalogenase [Pelagibacteraceae bacterium]
MPKNNNILRTPDKYFKDLPLWNYKPKYFTSNLYNLKVRIAYYDIGKKSAKETLVLTHGMSAWSYLYRRMIPPLINAGYRVILFDQVGCGRSDKPAKEKDYSYQRHIGWNIDLLINFLKIKDVSIVLQDWGGLIGLRVVAAYPGLFRRIVIANTMLPTCDDNFFKVSKGFYNWKTFAFRTKLKDNKWIKERGNRWPGQIMAQKAIGPSNPKMSVNEMNAYNAPYPDDTFKAGARMFPELVPTPLSDPTKRPAIKEAENNTLAWAVFQNFTKPVLLAFSDEDTVMAGCDIIWKKLCPGTRYKGVNHKIIKGVGHFLQDGGADQLFDAIKKFIEVTPHQKIKPFQPTPALNTKDLLDKEKAETKATKLAVAHGDKGISSPSDGGISFIEKTPKNRKSYQ